MSQNAEHRLPIVGVLLAVLLVFAACGRSSEPPAVTYVVGLATNTQNGMGNVRGFVDGMRELGYVEGTNIRYIGGRQPVTGADLDREIEGFVQAQVDLIFTAGTPTGVAAHQITEGTGVPVVFGVIADPVAAGVLDDLSRPGGNMTGVKLGENQDRRLELLLQIAPAVKRVFVPYNPDDSAAKTAVDQIGAVAPALGVELVLGEARDDAQVVDLLENVPDGIDAIFMVPDSTVNRHLEEIVQLAALLRVPTSGPSTVQVNQGALTTYGFIHEEAGKQAARIADQVLRGADPGELPVENTESFLAVNLATAAAIGLEVGDDILQQARVIVRDGASQ